MALTGPWDNNGQGPGADGNMGMPDYPGGPGENPGGNYWTPPPSNDGGYTPPPTDTGGGGVGNWSIPNWLNPGNWTDDQGTMAAALASGAYLNHQAGNYERAGNTAASMADPWAGQRQPYMQRLSDLYANPDSVKNTPGYQFALSQGLGALDRKDAARGLTGSGLIDKDRMDYAQGLASQTFDRERNALMQISGANFNNSPQAAQSYLHGQDLAAQSRALAASNVLQAGLGTLYAKNRPDGSTTKPGITVPSGWKVGGDGKLNIPGVGSFSPGSVLPNGNVFYGSNPDGTPHVGSGDQGGYPGEPDGGYTPGGDPAPGPDQPGNPFYTPPPVDTGGGYTPDPTEPDFSNIFIDP